MSEETRQRMSAAKKGKPGSNAGKLHTKYGHLVETSLRAVMRRVQAHGFVFNLTLDEVRDMLVVPCHYCGAEPRMPRAGCIDVLDTGLGYVHGNVVSCCCDCSSMKWTKGEIEFIAKCKKIVDLHGHRLPTIKISDTR